MEYLVQRLVHRLIVVAPKISCVAGIDDSSSPPRPGLRAMIGSNGGEISTPGTRKIRVAIAHARRLTAEALRALIAGLPAFVVTDVVSLEEGEAVTVARNADLILVGVGTEPGGAPEFVRLLRALTEQAEIVVLADSAEPDLVQFVLDQHLNGLLTSEASVEDFVASLDQVTRGHAVLPAGWQEMLLTNQLDDPLTGLSDRQMEVLELLAEGCSYEEIAARLFISINTVKFHVRSIFSQLGVRNRVAAARLLARSSRASPAPRPAVY
jgi:DNA-binding NarL/FixJ family response regulator